MNAAHLTMKKTSWLIVDAKLQYKDFINLCLLQYFHFLTKFAS